MRKQTFDSQIELSQHYLKNHQLEAALTVMQQLNNENQMVTGSDFSVRGQLLWCKILIAKSKYTGNPSYATLALSKIEELGRFIPPVAFQNPPISLTILQAEANILLNNWTIASQLADKLLKKALSTQVPFHLIEAYHLQGKISINNEDYLIALDHLRSAQELVIEHQHIEESLVLQNYLLLSQVLYLQNEFEQALYYSKKTFALAQEVTFLEEYLIEALLISSSCAKKQKEYGMAMQLLLEASDRSEKIHHQQLSNNCKLDIGVLYNTVSDHDRAINLFAELQKENQYFLKNRRTDVIFQLEWGKAYYHSQQYSNAKSLFEKIIAYSDESYNLRSKVVAYAYLSCISTAQEEIPSALRLAKKCNQYMVKISSDLEGSQINLINLGNIHFKLGKNSEAIKLTSRGIATAKRLGDEFSEIKGFRLMAKIFHQQKDYKNAFLYQTIYSKFYEDFFIKNARQTVRDIEHKYEKKKWMNNHNF